MTHAKILITYGPACASEEKLKQLIVAGATAVRYNFSHGNETDYAHLVTMVRRISTELHFPIAILADLQGPKIRCGEMPPAGLMLNSGDRVLLAEVPGADNLPWVPVSAKLLKNVKVNDRIMFNDGKLEAVVLEIADNGLIVKIKYGGLLTSRKGLNFPDTQLDVPSMTPEDKKNVAIAIKYGVDFIALSFIRSGQDIRELRQLIEKHHGHNIPIIAKIEKPEAIQHLQEILAESEGVMVARGDLGVEMSTEAIPILQKQIIGQANHAGKLVITATQMLESMISSSRPTRAEATDVANAILDGTDVVMLSGETAQGEFAFEAVSTMKKIIVNAELHEGMQHHDPDKTFQGGEDFPSTICRAAVASAERLHLQCICVFTQSGSTALFTSKYRPYVPIIAFTPNVEVSQRCAMYHGVKAFVMEPVKETDLLLAKVDKMMAQLGIAKKGEQIAVIFGSPVAQMGFTNTLKFHIVGETI